MDWERGPNASSKDYLQIPPDLMLRRMHIRTKHSSVSVGAMMETTQNRRILCCQDLSFMTLLKGRGIITPRIPEARHRAARKLILYLAPALAWTGF